MRQLGRPVVVAWVVIFTIALAVRCTAAVYWQNQQVDQNSFAFGDSFSYWVLGHQLYEGNEYQFGGPNARIARAPGFPVLIAGWHWLFNGKPSVLSVRMMNATLGALTVLAVGWLGSLMFDVKVGLYAGALATLYPGAIAMSILILSEGPFCLFMVLELIAMYLCFLAPPEQVSQRGRMALLLGTSAALAVLIRPSWLLYTPALLGVICLCGKKRRQKLFYSTLAGLAFVVVMLPWWVRNYRVTGRYVPTTLQVGASLYDGLRPGATGASDMSYMQDFYREQTHEDQLRNRVVADTYEYRLNSRLREASLAWAKENPTEVLRLAGVKFIRMWNVFPNSGEVGSGISRLIISIGYLGISILALLAVVSMIRTKPQLMPGTKQASWRLVALCGSPAVYFTALHMVFVSSIRYRQPAVLVFTVLAGVGVAYCVSKMPSLPLGIQEGGMHG